jgi:hypothetical protein
VGLNAPRKLISSLYNFWRRNLFRVTRTWISSE